MYLAKPLHALGVVELQFDGWAHRDETAHFLWDLLFYEPWFLGLGVLITLGALHHHRRTAGSAHMERQLVGRDKLATLAVQPSPRAVVIARSP